MKARLLDEIKNNIEDFDLTDSMYFDVSEQYDKTKSNFVFTKDLSSLKNIKKISFGKNSNGSKIYIGSNLSGALSITVEQKNCTVFIGEGCNLRATSIVCQALGAVVAVGNRVSTSGHNRWLSGAFPGSEFASIIVGDNCLFSSDITLRGTDGHPIMNDDFTLQINSPKDYLIIEPYVWVGQDVKIIKSVRVGACSIIGTSSVVTRSIPRFSKAYGVPAKFTNNSGVWLKDRTEHSLNMAKKYMLRYKNQ
ncbi:hypothetical protein K3H30_03810 [Aeromonas veronii]|uniref:acyltransferase n=1 Tax=Aeromonas veronii TaxID=654 RepID=UPI001F363FD5|nr:hypothetical protein [Aeromonas veronii]MCF5716837.1 hypothetical protein [Aeromonas veronii]